MALTANHRVLVETSGFLKGLPMASIARATCGPECVNSGLPLANSGEAVLWQSAPQVVDDFRTAARPFTVEVAIFAVFLDRTRHIRAFTTPECHQ